VYCTLLDSVLLVSFDVELPAVEDACLIEGDWLSIDQAEERVFNRIGSFLWLKFDWICFWKYIYIYTYLHLHLYKLTIQYSKCLYNDDVNKVLKKRYNDNKMLKNV